eukprot:4749804-Prymnesium_polylepis.1
MRIRFLTLSADALAVAEAVLRAMLDCDTAPKESDRDVQGDVAFYSSDDEVIRFMHTSPLLPSAPARPASLPTGSPLSAPPLPPSSHA